MARFTSFSATRRRANDTGRLHRSTLRASPWLYYASEAPSTESVAAASPLFRIINLTISARKSLSSSVSSLSMALAFLAPWYPLTVGEVADSLEIAIRDAVQHGHSISALLWRNCLLKTGQAKIRHRGQGLRIPRIHVVPLSHSGKQLVIKVNGNSQGRILVIDRSVYGGRTYRCQCYPRWHMPIPEHGVAVHDLGPDEFQA